MKSSLVSLVAPLFLCTVTRTKDTTFAVGAPQLVFADGAREAAPRGSLEVEGFCGGALTRGQAAFRVRITVLSRDVGGRPFALAIGSSSGAIAAAATTRPLRVVSHRLALRPALTGNPRTGLTLPGDGVAASPAAAAAVAFAAPGELWWYNQMGGGSNSAEFSVEVLDSSGAVAAGAASVPLRVTLLYADDLEEVSSCCSSSRSHFRSSSCFFRRCASVPTPSYFFHFLSSSRET